ncbi:MAG: GreA/GreB family elongation factor [Vulcanimicrobiaceae bacterium]
MSRAFVKDDDTGPEPVIPRPVSEAPNYVTPRGYTLLERALEAAQAAGDEREVQYYRQRLDSAIVVKPTKRVKSVVEFGASVTAHDARNTVLHIRIVGEDEADPAHGLVSWESPIAKAFTDHRVGDRAIVQRPAGPLAYTIDDVHYE